MEKTQVELNEEIRARAREFDMNTDEDALKAIDEMMGEGYRPSEETEHDGDTPVAESLTLIQFRETDAWRSILDGVANIRSDLKKKSENINLSRDERLSSMDQLQGVNAVLTFIGSQFQAAQERMAHLSSEEKILVGPEGRKEPSKTPVLPVVALNTQAAINFLEKGN